MRSFQFAVLVLFLTLSAGIHPAAAFSTEQSTGIMGGNPSNFADPDEQTPAYLSGPDERSSSWQIQSGPSVTPMDQSAATERNLGLSQAFDQAYSRK